jgi:CDP-6-deoxy-D-xylo-4-hexulose-3-dehydrase
MLFGGNLLRQPAFAQLQQERPDALRVVGEISGSDMIMNSSLFLGTYPGLANTMITFVLATIDDLASSG